MLNWKALTGSGRIPSNVKDQLKFLGALAKAEDDLARANFRKDVKDEWGRIERIVDQELERMAGLEKGEEVDLYLRCAMCNDDISNALLLMKKRGRRYVWSTYPSFPPNVSPMPQNQPKKTSNDPSSDDDVKY